MGDRTTSLRGKRVLVTGGAGFIGSHLVDRIAQEAPEALCVVDNLFLGRRENLADAEGLFPNLRFYQEDVCDADRMEEVVRDLDIEVVFHLAVVPLPASLERPSWSFDTNVRMSLVLCELLRAGSYETLIHFSSSEVYGTALRVPMDEDHPLLPKTPYAASKAASDHLALSYESTFGLDVRVLRPFNNYGPRQNDGSYAAVIPIVLQRALTGEPIEIHGTGDQTRDFIFVRDTAEAAVRAYACPECKGRAVNVASGEETSVNEIVRELTRRIGSDSPIRTLPPRPGDVQRHCGGIRLAEELLGFAPATALRDGLIETVEWYRNRVEGR